MIYGIEEMRLKNNMPNLSPEELKISQNEEGTYELARKLAIEIEMNLINTCNKYDKYSLHPKYKQQFQVIWSNLKDDNNFSLRRRVLTAKLSPKDLCTKEEAELYNPVKKNEIEIQ